MLPSKFKFPGKCFLLGEYSVLAGGPAVVVTLPPLFEAEFQKGRTETNPFSPASPAGRYWEIHKDFFREWKMTFSDPHAGAGGFGASTAEFAALAFARGIQNPWSVLELYRSVTRDLPRPPSGVDLVAQTQEGLGIFWIHTGQFQARRLEKFLPDGETLYLLRGPSKIPTHEHLAEIAGKDIPSSLMALSKAALNKERPLGRIFNEYSEALAAKGWEHPQTSQWLRTLRSWPYVSGAKGCGAMGADVLAVLVQKHGLQDFELKAKAKEMQIAFTFTGSN